MPLEIKIPAMGEGIVEATIIRWLVSEGSKVKKDDPLVEIATDKVDSEIVSPADGTIGNFQHAEGDVVEVGGVICTLSSDAPGQVDPIQKTSASKASAVTFSPKEPSTFRQQPSETLRQNLPSVNQPGNRFIAPFIRYLANREGIPVKELESLQGSGPDGKITKEDIFQYIQNRPQSLVTREFRNEERVEKKNRMTEPEIVSVEEYDENTEVRELDRTRKLIAKNMVQSKQISPHVSSFVEADITPMVNWRNRNKQAFMEKYGENLTFLPLMLEAVTLALKEYPAINATLSNDRLILKKQINIGIATALPNGNLIVPVIRNAGGLNLPGIARALNELTNKARNSALMPADIQGGTFTVTNIGTFGNIGGTPIINQPELAILAIGAIRKKPMAILTGNDYGVAVRDVVQLWLSYDHRVIDGFLGGSFLKHIANLLEAFDDQKIV